MPFEDPDGLDGAYLAVSMQGQTRLLATRPMAGLTPVANLTATLNFPQATLRATDVFPGIDVEVTLAGPTVPHRLDLASLPGFVVQWQVHNRSGVDADLSCRLAWPNLVGNGGGIDKSESQTGYADGFYRCVHCRRNSGGGNADVAGLLCQG